MEMRCIDKRLYKWLWAFCCMLLLHHADAQVQVKSYTVKDGKMFIALDKDLSKNSIDSFADKYDLRDLDLSNFIKTGLPDSLDKLGWKIVINNKEVVVISKPLYGADNLNDLAGNLMISISDETKAHLQGATNQAHFGYNQFKNKYPFAVSDSVVTFFLRGNTNAGKVMLAGTFNDWSPAALAMKKTDSGWIADVKLGAGKYWYKFIADGNWTTDKDNAFTENDGLGNDNSVYYKTNYVFTLDGYTRSKKVYVAGSFNDWKEKDMRMLPTATGWRLPVYLSQGTYIYRFIADGNWFADPANPEKLPNEYGDYNSVIRIGRPYLFTLDGYTDAKKVVLFGSFNNWKDNELYMHKTATGWELPYTLGPGNYEYKLKIDGQEAGDPFTQGNIALVIDPNFTFRLKGFANAKTVYLSGDLNNWNPSSFRMTREGDEWIFKAHLNKGKHRYKFVVDGEWILDPANKLWEQNEYQTGNSILWIDSDQYQ